MKSFQFKKITLSEMPDNLISSAKYIEKIIANANKIIKDKLWVEYYLNIQSVKFVLKTHKIYCNDLICSEYCVDYDSPLILGKNHIQYIEYLESYLKSFISNHLLEGVFEIGKK